MKSSKRERDIKYNGLHRCMSKSKRNVANDFPAAALLQTFYYAFYWKASALLRSCWEMSFVLNEVGLVSEASRRASRYFINACIGWAQKTLSSRSDTFPITINSRFTVTLWVANRLLRASKNVTGKQNRLKSFDTSWSPLVNRSPQLFWP